MSMGGGGKKGGMPKVPSEATSLANPILYYKQRTGYYPNNTQVWWSMKRPPEVGTDRPPKTYLEVFDPGLRHQVSSGNTPAAKGHYIYNAFHQDRSLVSGVGGIPVKSTSARPSAVAFYAGRVFYAGAFTAGFNTKVYFSQIIERPDQVGECYQSQDPTSEDLRDLLPSDGGVIVIPEIVRIHHMVPYGFDLYVFASNGVWRIAGSDGLGFRADDYSVSKISGVPTVSNIPFVDVEGVPIWWNRSSINTLAPTQGGMQVVSLTDESIKKLYQSIPEQSKFYAKGAYDPLTKQVQFLYRSTETTNDEEIFNYDKVLVMDTRNGAWMPWSLTEHPRVVVKGIFPLEGSAVEQEVTNVLAGTDTVLVGTDILRSLREYRVIKQSKIKYIVNVLDETEAPPPPDAAPPTNLNVLVSDDTVEVVNDPVVVTQWSS